MILRDNRHLWSAYNVAPLVRKATLQTRPAFARVLNGVSPAITDRAARSMNAAVENSAADPADVAAAFLKSLGGRTNRS